MIRCVHNRPVASDGLGCSDCGGPALLPEPDRGAEGGNAPRSVTPQQYDEAGADPRDTAWWQR